MDLGLEGRGCVLTGSTGGIGLETARLLVAEGARVVTSGRSEQGPGIGEVLHVPADLARPGEPERLVETAIGELGGLDCLVNNVGVARIARFEYVEDEEWDAYWQLNVMSYVRTIRAALPLLRAGGGAIVNVSSTAGKRPSTGMPHYSVTKAAVLSLSRLVADLYAGDGVRCNAVAPGPTATEAWLADGGLADQSAARSGKTREETLAAVGAGRPLGRLTHTIETTCISRTVARALRLNEDLVEAIGLGHDLGHTPFGHAGEEALDGVLQERFGQRFRHNEHSLRVVDVLERGGRGLNLTAEVRDGILNHTGPNEPDTLEGKIVRLVDRVAYINHDIDDAIRAGVLDADDLPREEIELLGPTGSRRIDRLVHDLVETSAREGEIRQSEDVGAAMSALRTFMFERVYLAEGAAGEHARARTTVHRIFDHLIERGEDVDAAIDYVAGMTDRFALAYAEELE